jgi:hypothetical protein
MATLQEIINGQVRPFLSSELLSAKPEKLSLRSLVLAWAITKFVKDLTDKRLKVLRPLLIEKAKKSGVLTESKGRVLETEGSSIFIDNRESKLPDPEKIKKLLSEKGLRIDAAFTKPTPDWELDASKLKRLVSNGKLTQAEVDKAKTTVEALRVRPASVIDDALFFASGGSAETGKKK